MSRLRMALLSFMMASIAVGALVWWQMDRLAGVETAVFELALPSLQLNQQINKNMTGVISYASEMAGNVPRERIPLINQSLSKEKKRVYEMLDAASSLIGTHVLRTETRERFIEIDIATDSMFKLLEKQSALSDINADILARLRALQLDFSLSSEIIYLESSSRLIASAQYPRVDQLELQANINEFSTYIEIESRINQLFFLTEGLAKVDELITLRNLQDKIQFTTKKVVQALLLRSENKEKSDLAITIDKLRILIVGENGLIDNQVLLLEAEGRRTELSTQILKVAAQISVIQAAAISEAENTVSNVGKVLRKTIAQTMLICLLGVATILLPVIAINQIVLKRQIGDRMKLLTKTVEEIAEGNLGTEVDTSGQDEISTIAKALEKFKRSAQELARSNADLERFAYVASHDLCAPLQSIHNLASWTVEDCGPELSDENRENLNLLISRVGRMRRLSNDLLLYAKLNEATHKIERFSCRELIEDAIDLVASESDFKFDLDIGIDLVVGPVTPVRQIIRNIVSNSIKHHDAATGMIWICVQKNANNLLVSIRDDGPGIPKEYQKQVFEPFRTLQSRDEIEGSGMGLAIILRLLQTFDGRIELQSEPLIARGTKFTFEIPLEQIASGKVDNVDLERALNCQT